MSKGFFAYNELAPRQKLFSNPQIPKRSYSKRYATTTPQTPTTSRTTAGPRCPMAASRRRSTCRAASSSETAASAPDNPPNCIVIAKIIKTAGPSATPTAASTASPAIASTSINPRAASPSTFSGAGLAQPGDYYEVMKHGLAGLIS